MKKKVWLYVCLGAAAALLVGAAVAVFLLGEPVALGVLCCFAAAITLGVLLAAILQNRLETKCYHLFEQKEYTQLKELLEQVMEKHFYYPLVRMVAMQYYIAACMALDELALAEQHIARLRHGGGMGWVYKTAYCFILIHLDKGDIDTARSEFEDFRKQNANVEIYKQQIEILSALFARLFTAKHDEKLPESVLNSAYPVVKRILGKHFEANAENTADYWED